MAWNPPRDCRGNAPGLLRGKIARPLIDNENLPDPPERPQGKGEKGGGKAGCSTTL